MAIDDLRKYNRDTMPQDICDSLIEMAGLKGMEGVDAAYEGLDNALYDLRAMAENEYNADYWRVLWNVLSEVATTAYIDWKRGAKV